MHFHLPKPMHGWRTFVGEVGIIVVGVLIALGAEQVVSNWHWQRDAADTDRRIGEELRLDLVNAYERLAITTCLEPRLAELRDKLIKDEAIWPGTRARFANDLYKPGFPAVYRTPNRSWPSDAWETALNGESLGHFEHGRAAQFASLYDAVESLKQSQSEEVALSASLGDLAFPGPISAADRRANLKLVARLDALNARILFDSRQILDEAGKAGLTPEPVSLKRSLDQQRSYRGSCVQEPPLAPL